ncbi:hypothetical protein CRV08_08920 [Halarcobacter ebronensis]|uniref:histidine kinase n=1 Tax=Halarcobacter ebronensis TaxID=1462615 RepID=A0A4Q0YC41_9BACT|nr:ATP-binding protein [Halarcobacter ebronensis]RXJ67927.1 hypothetical protein CRV08_08920 [Halarcobacter ebronensis]
MKNSFRYLLILLIIVIPIFFTINYFLKVKLDSIMDNKHQALASSINSLIEQSIEDKSKATLNIALAISEFASKNTLFTQRDNKKFEVLKNISSEIKNNSNFKHLWIHIVDKNGVSRYRTWTEKVGDNVLSKRKELIDLIKNPKITNIISVGIFDITFKSIIPVYEEGEFQGFIETITKFNSIADKFQDKGVDFLLLVDKKYKDQIKKPFTKKFVKEYYVANIDAKDSALEIMDKNLDTLLNIKNYTINNDKFITLFKLYDFKKEHMAYIFTLQNYDKVFSKEVNNLENFIKIIGYLLILIIIAIFTIFYYFNKAKYTKKLEEEVNLRTKEIEQLNRRYKQIFDGSKVMKILVDPITKKIYDANKSTLNFYGYTKEQITSFTTLDFNANRTDADDFIFEKILKNEEYRFVIKHKLSNEEIKDIEIHASLVNIGDKEYIYCILRDITKDLKLQNEYEEKQKLFYQQAKMASMGEMLENIAHQWRQPLSTITTAASGMKVQKEFGILDDKFFNDSIDTIVKSSNFLSQTIEDFRNFFKRSNAKETFTLEEAVEDLLKIISIKLKTNNIDFNLINDNSYKIRGYKNEFIQVFLNFINNSIDAFTLLDAEKKIILVESTITSNAILITFQDSAGGIGKDTIEKVFEPYFTTKYKSQGTGIGLYMSEEIITKHFKGKLNVKNSNFTWNSKEYFGAKFIIELPLN